MSILKYENFTECEQFSEINLACMRLRDDDDSKLRDLVAKVPADLRQELSLYLLDYSITRQSGPMLKLATELGVFDIPGVKNNLEIAVAVRDRMFTSSKEPSAGHLEILRQAANHLGEGFAIDSMSAVYNNEFARIRSDAKSFASGREKLDSYSANLSLFKRFTPAKFLNNPEIGNIGIRHIRFELVNLRDDEPIGNHLKELAELHFDDYVAIANVITSNPELHGKCVPHQIDAGVVKGLAEMSRDYLVNLVLALKIRPTNTLMTLATMKESEFSRFVSCDGIYQYLSSQWITKDNAGILLDQNFLDLHELFNNRLLGSPYLGSVFERNHGLSKPSDISVSFAMMLPALKAKDLYIDLSNKNGLKSLAKSLNLLSDDPRHEEVLHVGREAIRSELSRKVLNLYAKMATYDESFAKHMKPVDQVDKEDQFKLIAVRLCAELHQPDRPLTNAEASKIRPIGQFFGMNDSGLNHKEALLSLVQTYDEATILNALKGYKAGIKPLIELGVLDRKHMTLLPAKDRGEILEGAMGL